MASPRLRRLRKAAQIAKTKGNAPAPATAAAPIVEEEVVKPVMEKKASTVTSVAPQKTKRPSAKKNN